MLQVSLEALKWCATVLAENQVEGRAHDGNSISQINFAIAYSNLFGVYLKFFGFREAFYPIKIITMYYLVIVAICHMFSTKKRT